jgi:hypothetical protein
MTMRQTQMGKPKERVSCDEIFQWRAQDKRNSFFYRFSSIKQKKEFVISQKERKRISK